MCPLVTNSNYFKILSTVTFLDSQTELISGIFLFKTVILYHYMFIHMIIQGIIFAAPVFRYCNINLSTLKPFCMR